MLTLTELKEKLAKELDEITLLEVLDIRGNDLVEAFEDRIEERFDQLIAEFDPEDDSDEESEV
jgi:hypothetical protein